MSEHVTTYLNRTEAIAELNRRGVPMCLATWKNLLARGEGPVETQIGVRVFVASGDLEAWLRSQRRVA